MELLNLPACEQSRLHEKNAKSVEVEGFSSCSCKASGLRIFFGRFLSVLPLLEQGGNDGGYQTQEYAKLLLLMINIT